MAYLTPGFRSALTAAAVAMATALTATLAVSADAPSGNALIEADIWPTLQKDVFGDRAPVENPKVVTIEAPGRADDAALVPLTVRIAPDASASVKKLTLIVDKNPAPVVGEFEYGPAAGSGERMLSTRVRVDMYSNVRAIVETADGKLHMATQFVKAAGGCSAPALKDTDAALAEAGRMLVKTFDGSAAAATREGQLMIKHPQYSGLQLNQATGYYIPAKFIREIDVKRGGETVFRMTGGISISEDPNIRFTYAPGGDETLEVVAKDTDGKSFTGRGGPKGS
ncbi:MAG: quinoprotein dehydrogenase-associated SoxYZ-like carrier [Hyphomicrobium sp.]|nr:quinoprotein dehydrogenase-associated SoxYZ-like carrier [Hyphomicrobium sp.]